MTPSGAVQQSPWLSIANKQLELMGRYVVELGLTPAARNRVGVEDPRMQLPAIERTVYEDRPAAVLTDRPDALAPRQEKPQ